VARLSHALAVRNMPCILRLLITTLYSKQSGHGWTLDGLMGTAMRLCSPLAPSLKRDEIVGQVPNYLLALWNLWAIASISYQPVFPARLFQTVNVVMGL
jgi:hypothetical protein